MKVEIKPISTIKARIGIQEGGPAHAFFTNSCYRHMGQFVPGGEDGMLNQNVDLQIDSITYKSPYAHYQYIGKLYVDPKYKVGAFPIRGGEISFDKADGMIEGYVSRKGIAKVPTNKDLEYHTPGTGNYWDKKMWSSKSKEVIKEVQAYVDRGCK